MRTKIGDYLRELRLKNNQTLKDMADELGVTSSFLSAVENGKKNFPYTWYGKFKKNYDLSESELEEMKQTALESQKTISIRLNNVSHENRELAVSFARKFDNIDEETSKRILIILKESEGSNHGGKN